MDCGDVKGSDALLAAELRAPGRRDREKADSPELWVSEHYLDSSLRPEVFSREALLIARFGGPEPVSWQPCLASLSPDQPLDEPPYHSSLLVVLHHPVSILVTAGYRAAYSPPCSIPRSLLGIRYLCAARDGRRGQVRRGGLRRHANPLLLLLPLVVGVLGYPPDESWRGWAWVWRGAGQGQAVGAERGAGPRRVDCASVPQLGVHGFGDHVYHSWRDGGLLEEGGRRCSCVAATGVHQHWVDGLRQQHHVLSERRQPEHVLVELRRAPRHGHQQAAGITQERARVRQRPQTEGAGRRGGGSPALLFTSITVTLVSVERRRLRSSSSLTPTEEDAGEGGPEWEGEAALLLTSGLEYPDDEDEDSRAGEDFFLERSVREEREEEEEEEEVVMGGAGVTVVVAAASLSLGAVLNPVWAQDARRRRGLEASVWHPAVLKDGTRSTILCRCSSPRGSCSSKARESCRASRTVLQDALGCPCLLTRRPQTLHQILLRPRGSERRCDAAVQDARAAEWLPPRPHRDIVQGVGGRHPRQPHQHGGSCQQRKGAAASLSQGEEFWEA
ncbi:hypothetical protein E2C01_006640 [Portunus trituberculatus]|uniref:Uncharacterized protein n=1 Tax=Portunus trituberculatus TaxID=210409 RepID=A0A5B7CYD5_PORTR|nr:hypothetical protein [Portunus trituberculatus]